MIRDDPPNPTMLGAVKCTPEAFTVTSQNISMEGITSELFIVEGISISADPSESLYDTASMSVDSVTNTPTPSPIIPTTVILEFEFDVTLAYTSRLTGLVDTSTIALAIISDSAFITDPGLA